MHAEHLGGVGVDHELECSEGVLISQRARNVLAAQHPAVAGVPGHERLGLGQPGAGDLRAGEDDRRQAGVVDLGLAAEGVLRGSAPGLGGDVDVLRRTGDVSGRPHLRVRGLLPGVDGDEPALVDFDPGRGEVQAVGARSPAVATSSRCAATVCPASVVTRTPSASAVTSAARCSRTVMPTQANAWRMTSASSGSVCGAGGVPDSGIG